MIVNRIRTLATAAAKGKHSLQDIVIIGGGPAGLSLLAALKNSNRTKHLSCTLIEGGSLDKVREFQQDPPEEYTNRVVSLTPKSIQFMLNKIGNWLYIHENRLRLYENIVAYDSQDNNLRIRFNGRVAGIGPLAAMCEVLNIQGSLVAKIDELNEDAQSPANLLDNTKVVDIISPQEPDLDNHNLSDTAPGLEDGELDWPIVKLSNGDSIQARLLIGADGYNSPVRKFSGIESRGWQYNRFGVVATIKMQYDDFRSMAWQRFLTTGPLAILPLSDNNATIVWSSTPELSELLLKVDDRIFPSLINAGMCLEEVDLNYIYGMLRKDPADMAVLDEIEWRMSKITVEELEEKLPSPVATLVEGSRARFPLKMSHADTYVAPRVALVGDAAHTTHPLAGQGLNMGITDVSILTQALETGVERGLDIGSTLVLEKYVADAWPMNHALLGVTDKLHKIFSTDWYPIVWARGIGMKSIDFLEFAKDIMVKAISNR